LKVRSVLTASVLLSLLFTLPIRADITLPDIGDSSSAYLSPQKADRIGRQMYQQFRDKGEILQNPELEEYVKSVGYRLLSASGLDAQHFTFFIVNDPQINAFAMPGGYIGVNTGLITATRSESELAAVLAHECGHVLQHHIARSLERASHMNLPMTAAVIAAILLGAHSPDAGEAALAGAMGGSAQMQLKFSRSNEREADRVGMELLERSGFDPRAMPAFFERLQKATRYDGSVPEFLQTHPVTVERIADAENRADQYPKRDVKSSEAYFLARAKITVMNAADASAVLQHYRDQLRTKQYANGPAARYGYALALAKAGNYDEAQRQLEQLVRSTPNRAAFRLALAQVEMSANRFKQAATVCADALKLFPDNAPLNLAYARALIHSDRPRQASELLYQFTTNNGDDVPPQAYKLLSQAEGRRGRQGSAHIALADYYHAVGELPTAIEQLELARKDKDLDFYQQSRIDAKLAQFKQEAAQDKQSR